MNILDFIVKIFCDLTMIHFLEGFFKLLCGSHQVGTLVRSYLSNWTSKNPRSWLIQD